MIHVLRPYASEEEYLAAERTSIDSKSMLLIDQPPLAADTAVVFDVTLSNGDKPIRAEGKVLEHVAPSADQPGGLRVRFKRFGAATKAFIDRAVSDVPPLATSVASVASTVSIAPAASIAPAVSAADETSGVHRRVASSVSAPLDREALLERLRARRAG